VPAWAFGVNNVQNLLKSTKEHPWATNFLAHAGLVTLRPQGNQGAENTPPAGPMIRDQCPVSPPAVPVANLDLRTPEGTIKHPFPTTQLPPCATNVAPAQLPASLTPPARGSSIKGSKNHPANTQSTPGIPSPGRHWSGGKQLQIS